MTSTLLKKAKRIAKIIFPTGFYGPIKRIFVERKIARYRKHIPSLEEKIFSKEKIRVVFFAINISMWKYDELFKLMLSDSRFEPYVISFIYPDDPFEFIDKTQNEMEHFFNKIKGYTFFKSYCTETKQWLDLKAIAPDLVFYTQPYNLGYGAYRIESLWKSALFLYTPYAFWIERGAWGYNALLHNVAWKLFYPTHKHLKYAVDMSYVRGRNVVVTGYPLADNFLDIAVQRNDLWKMKDPNLKRIIWAPHHSILKTDVLNYSNFLRIADEMLELANKYKESIQIAFKPHPILRKKLSKSSIWGEDRTTYYYNQWADLPNGLLAEGEYIDLFITSDAMIHDSSSFSVEYLYTHKPVMYVTKEDHLDYLCDFGRLSFDMHYKGYTMNDIEEFINKVVLEGKDSMKSKREAFFLEYLLPPHNKSVAQNTFDEISKYFR